MIQSISANTQAFDSNTSDQTQTLAESQAARLQNLITIFEGLVQSPSNSQTSDSPQNQTD